MPDLSQTYVLFAIFEHQQLPVIKWMALSMAVSSNDMKPRLRSHRLIPSLVDSFFVGVPVHLTENGPFRLESGTILGRAMLIPCH